MHKLNLLIILLLSLGQSVQAQEGPAPKQAFKAPNGKEYPAHWGQPPLRQTRDLRVLPGGYGRGSGTLARWIQKNLELDLKDPSRETKKNKTGAKGKEIQQLRKEIARMKDFMSRAKFTPKGAADYKARLIKKEDQLAGLTKSKDGDPKKNTPGAKNVPTFAEWVKGGKKIPEGMVFTGGSPWFNERTGGNRSAEEVYRMIFNKPPKK